MKTTAITKFGAKFLGVAIAAVFGLSADAIAAEANLKADDGLWNSSFTNAANWLIGGTPSGGTGAALNPATDYFIRNGRTCRTPAYADSTFAGHSLHVGKIGGENGTLAFFAARDPLTVDFSNGNGLVLEYGVLCGLYGKTNIVTGKVAVESGTSAPVRMYCNNNGGTFIFKAAITGGTSKSLWLATRDNPSNTSWGQKNFVCHFLDNSLAGYTGKINCYKCYPEYATVAASDEWRTEYSASSDTPFPGTLVLGNNCAVRGENSETTVSVANLDFKANSCVNVIYNKTTKKASCVKVTSSFTHEGRIRIILSGHGYTTGNYPDSLQIPEIAVFKAPAGVTLDPGDFKLETAVFPVIEMYVREDTDGLSTLFLRQPCTVVTNTTTDDGASDQSSNSSFIGPAHWSSGAKPDKDHDYYTTKSLRAYASSSAELVFRGHSLAYNGGSLLLLADNTRVDDYRVVYGTHKIHSYKGSGYIVALRGALRLASGAKVNVNVHESRKLKIDSEIEGPSDATLVVQLFNNNYDQPGYAYLGGLNTNFFGKVVFTSEKASNTESKTAFVTITDGRNLGGPLSAWTYDALKMDKSVNVIVTNSLELSTAKRGIYIAGPVYFDVRNSAVFAVKERMTWVGQLTKKGTGTLALGGASPFFSTGGSTTPTSGKNTLTVRQGRLRALSSNAFQGVALSFASGTGLEISVPEDKADWDSICKFGVKNTLIDNPIAISAGTLPVTVVPANGSDIKPAGLKRVAICTVKTTAAQSLGLTTAKFSLANTPYKNCSQHIEESVDANAGTTTFYVAYDKGFVISFH